MSADNYMAVKTAPDGKVHVWMVLGGEDDRDWDIPTGSHFCGGVFGNKDAAMKHAYKVCREEVVEYGVVDLDYA